MNTTNLAYTISNKSLHAKYNFKSQKAYIQPQIARL